MDFNISTPALALGYLFDKLNISGASKSGSSHDDDSFKGLIDYYVRYNANTSVYSILMRVESTSVLGYRFKTTPGKAVVRTVKKQLRLSNATIYREYIPGQGAREHLTTINLDSFDCFPRNSYVNLGSCKKLSTAVNMMKCLQGTETWPKPIPGLDKATNRTSKEWILDIGQSLPGIGFWEAARSKKPPLHDATDTIRNFVEPERVAKEKAAKLREQQQKREEEQREAYENRERNRRYKSANQKALDRIEAASQK